MMISPAPAIFSSRAAKFTADPKAVNSFFRMEPKTPESTFPVAIPMPAPEPNDVLDARNIALGVGLGILAAGLFIIWLARRHKAARIIRHGAFWPWMRRKGESANDTLA